MPGSALVQPRQESHERQVVVGQGGLSIDDVVAVALQRIPVSLAPQARDRMTRARAAIEAIHARGERVYGLSTGVGAQKTIAVSKAEQAQFNRQMILGHAVGHGPLAPSAYIRAAMLVRAEGLALGAAAVRPELAEALIDAVNADAIRHVHLLGSVGQSDIGPLAEIGCALIGEGKDAPSMQRAGLQSIRLGPREALALISSNAFSAGIAALATAHAWTALRALGLSAALSFEGFVANVMALDPSIAALRPHEGVRETIDRLRDLLAGGSLLRGLRAPRSLQDPLCFRVVPQTYGAAWSALRHLQDVIAIELRSSGDNPALLLEEDRIVANGNHDSTPLTIALDSARLGLAQAVSIANERIEKLLDARFTGLPSGLRAEDNVAEDGLGVMGHGSAALTAEIRLLAAPVALEMPTTGLAEGIEDRISLAPTAATRLDEMAGYTMRLAAIELVCAAQAIDLRGAADELGRGTAPAYAAVRARHGFLRVHETPDQDLDPLVRWLDQTSASGPRK